MSRMSQSSSGGMLHVPAISWLTAAFKAHGKRTREGDPGHLAEELSSWEEQQACSGHADQSTTLTGHALASLVLCAACPWSHTARFAQIVSICSQLEWCWRVSDETSVFAWIMSTSSHSIHVCDASLYPVPAALHASAPASPPVPIPPCIQQKHHDSHPAKEARPSKQTTTVLLPSSCCCVRAAVSGVSCPPVRCSKSWIVQGYTGVRRATSMQAEHRMAQHTLFRSTALQCDAVSASLFTCCCCRRHHRVFFSHMHRPCCCLQGGGKSYWIRKT